MRAQPESMAQVYPVSARLLHWAMAALILSMLFLGVAMVSSLAEWRTSAIGLHKSFGALALLLVILRLANRVRFKAPALPAGLSGAQKLAARATHWLLYGLMLAVPLSGWAMQGAAGLAVRPFGLFTLPAIAPEGIALYGLFRDLHGLFAWGLFGLVLIHLSAALHHGLVRGDNVLGSMLGRRGR